MASDENSNEQTHESPPENGRGPQESSAPVEEGLPPVAPPSGRFIAQLFLIPSLIVAVLVIIYLVGTYLVVERRSARYYLDNLDSTNQDIRWRTASDLAQVLKRPESLELASNPKFALDLAQRLKAALDDLHRREQFAQERVKDLEKEEEKAKEWNKLRPDRNYVLFLIASLGDFTIPIGAPLLCEIAEKQSDDPLDEEILRRRRAVWALANLGSNLERYDKELSDVKRRAVVAFLNKEQKKSGARGDWAQASYLYLTTSRSLKVDETLARCAEAEDTFLRELVAMALNFWDGPNTVPTLLKLTKDDGHGTRVKVKDYE